MECTPPSGLFSLLLPVLLSGESFSASPILLGVFAFRCRASTVLSTHRIKFPSCRRLPDHLLQPKHLATARFHRLQPCYLPFKPTPQPPIISFPSFVFPTASSQQTSPWPTSTAQQTPDNPCLFKSEVTESRLPCRQISYPSLCEQMRRDGKPGKQPQQDSKVTAQRRSGSLSPPITQLKTATRPSHVMSAPYQPMQGARASFLAPCCAPCTLHPWLSPPGVPPLPHHCSSRAACKWSPSSVPSPFPTPTFPDFSWDPRLTFPSFQSTVSLEITDCRPRFHSFREPVMPPCPRNS